MLPMQGMFLFVLALRTLQMELGGHLLTVEVAETPKSWTDGLKGRRQLPEDHGMLFIYEKPHILTFWMQDTLIPLSIGFFDEEKTLLHTLDMFPPEDKLNPPLFNSLSPAQYALEVPLGWFRKHQVLPGMKFSFE